MELAKDDRVEYAVHSVSWQEEGHALPHAEIEEEWQPATVLEVREVPDEIRQGHHAHSQQVPHKYIVRIQPEDGSPPFEIPAGLIRTEAGLIRTEA